MNYVVHDLDIIRHEFTATSDDEARAAMEQQTIPVGKTFDLFRKDSNGYTHLGCYFGKGRFSGKLAAPTYFGGQSRTHSLIEATANPLIGYLVAVATQILVFPFFGVHLPVGTNFKLGGIFFVVSVIRSYMVRRAFNYMTERK